ncbi:hypothetical protein LAZ67_2006692, partial [Cordylochernes scorpioides]
MVWAESPSKAEDKPVRLGSKAQPSVEITAKDVLQNKNPIVLTKNKNYVNPSAGSQDANSAAPVDLAAIPTSDAAAQIRRNWADITEEVNPGAEEGFTLVQGRKRRRGSANSPTAAAPSSNPGGSRTIRRPQPSAGSVPRAQEIRVTRAHIAEARARQASSSEEHCVYIEHSPELEPFHYLRALDRMLGGTAGVIQITKVNGHQLLGLTNRGLAERLISEGLEVEGTLLRAFPFRKRAERITVGNLPFFVADSAVITALSPYGRVTSIAPKQMKAGPYVYVDGRRDVFITLHEGITIERLPTRLDINIKGQAWPGYLSSGIRCSRCHGQGHRRAICPLLAGLANNTRTAPPTTPAGVPPPTTPAPPQRSAAQPPAPTPSNPAMEVCSAPPVARAALHSSAPRPSPPAAPAFPMEETPPAPPPVTPAPSLQTPGSREPAAPTPDVEMSIVEETFASSTSSAKNATRVDLDAFIEGLPSVSFAKTDALGLGREEVLDLLSSRTKAQRKGPLLSPPQCDALVGLIGQILDLKPGHTSNLYKVLGQVKAELRTTPAVPPTPTLPAPWPSKPTPPALHGEKTSPDIATPPPPLSTEFIDACYDQANDIIYELSDERYSETLSDIGVTEGDIVEAIIFPDDREPLLRRLSTQKRTTLAGIVSAASERARSSDPFNEIPIVLRKNQNYVNPPAGSQDANSAAPVDLAAIPTSNAAAQVRRNWADITEEVNPGAEEGFTLVQGRKRRRGSADSPTAAAPSSNSGGARSSRRLHSSARSVPRAQEIPTTRTHITEARARQASSSEEHCVYLEHGPELQPFHYLRALDRLLGGTAGVVQVSKVNGHQLLGLANRGLAERLINNGLEVEGTLLRAFPFRKRAERITVSNLPFFVEDSAIINALRPFGRITSISPKMMKAGPYTYTDGRREAFIVLHEGMTTERLPTRLDITIKGEAWPAYLSTGIKCSRCHGQGHRRANCPLLAGLANNTRTAPPTTPAGVPPPTTPAPPQRSAAQPPAPTPSNPAMEVCSAPPVARAALHSSAPRPSPPAAPAFPMEETPPAPPPVTPAPSLQTPGSREPAAPTPDVEMSIVEETLASFTSSAKKRNESRPRCVHRRAPQRVLGQVKAELRTTPAVPPTPTLPAPWPAKPTPPALHGEKTSPDIATPPPPLSTEFIDACYDQANDIIYELSDERYLETLSDIGVTEGDIVEAIIFPDDREPLLRRLSTQKRTTLAGIVSAASERARSSDPFVPRGRAWQHAALLSLGICPSSRALVYSVAEYCAPVWERSSHTDSIDAQLNQTMRLITRNMRPTPIDWLPYLSNIAPPDLRRKKSTSNLLSKIKANTKLPINTVLDTPPPTRLISRNPAWVAEENVDLKEEWRNRWSNLAIANKDLVEDPNTKPPGYNLPRRTWSTLNRIRTSTGRCNYLLNKWNMSPDQNCDCGQIQTMHHILRDCPRRFFQGTLGDIHRCTEEALEWIQGCDSLYCKYTTCLHSAVRPRVARAPEFFASGGRKVSRMATNMVWAESPSKAEDKPVRLGSKAQPSAVITAKDVLQINSSMNSKENENYVNPPAGSQDANSAAPVDLAAIPTANAAAQVRRNWADITEEVNPGAEEGFTLVQGRKRRRGSANSPTAAAPSSNAGGSRTIRRPQPSAGSVPRAQEIRVTRAHIAEARARQASSSEEHCVYIEHSPELEPFHYLRALDRMLGGTAGVIQITKVNGHQLLGLTNRGLAERLISEGLEVEGTLLRAFPFRKRAERITVGNLPFFIGDSAVINALSPYGRVTSIAPKQMKAGPYVYVDGRRDVFITLHEGITIERLPTRLDINIKGEAWPAYLSSGIRCSRCHGQGHRRAICPLLAGLANNTRMAPPTTPAGVPPPTTPAPPQRSAAQPSAPTPSNPAMEVCGAPPVAGAALHSSAPRPSPTAAPAFPMKETPPFPPPVTPAPSLRTPGSREPAAPTPDVEMSIVEETFASSTSSAKNATRVDLDAFIEGHPSVSFAMTDALGLGREEVLDLLSSRTKAQRKGPLLSPPQCDALVGLIGQILDLRPGAASNLYKVLGQVKAELRTTPAVPPTPTLPAPRPARPTAPAPQVKESTPAMATPPPPPSVCMEDDSEPDYWTDMVDSVDELMRSPGSEPILQTFGACEFVDAARYPEVRECVLAELTPRRGRILAQFLDKLIERTRDSVPLIRRGLSETRNQESSQDKKSRKIPGQVIEKDPRTRDQEVSQDKQSRKNPGQEIKKDPRTRNQEGTQDKRSRKIPGQEIKKDPWTRRNPGQEIKKDPRTRRNPGQEIKKDPKTRRIPGQEIKKDPWTRDQEVSQDKQSRKIPGQEIKKDPRSRNQEGTQDKRYRKIPGQERDQERSQERRIPGQERSQDKKDTRTRDIEGSQDKRDPRTSNQEISPKALSPTTKTG